MKKILFICTGNICRSVMAEFIFKKLIKKRSDFSVSSAGTETMPHYRIYGSLVPVMEKLGVDAKRHRPRQVTAAMLNEANYVIVMEKRHKEILTKLNPSAKVKIKLIKEFDHQKGNLEDPIHQVNPDYNALKDEIEGYLQKFIQKENLI